MLRHAHITTSATAAFLVALTLALTACEKKSEPTAVDPAASAASATPFQAKNVDKALADCDRLPDPKAGDESAAGRATAVSQGMAARAACKKDVTAQQDKPNADLARIREIKEIEQANQKAREVSNKEWFKGINEGAKKPIKEYKY